MCAPENWGNVFLIRTGSREFSRFMVTTNNAPYRDDIMGVLPPGYTHTKGRLHQFVKGEWIPLIIPEEQDW
ncbi:MAG: hypothetical protein GTO60_14995, partial [Gammaproteobacteria bacterium]|nr:hypothetical protein [Gammaproteobacteria bacterium]